MDTYLFTVALPLLPGSHRVKCRDELIRTVSKVLTAGHWGLMDGQRIRVFKNRVPAQKNVNVIIFIVR